MTLEAILAGIGAVVTAAGGVILVVRELRRRDRIASMRQIDELSQELTTSRQDLLTYQQWAFIASGLLISNGQQPPALPEIHPAEPEVNLKRRWQWRKKPKEKKE